jgi:hypothetical protein
MCSKSREQSVQAPFVGIWPPYEAFYIQSMLFNAESAARSLTRLEKVFEPYQNTITWQQIEQLPRRHILNELQNIVLQAGALSRYFWPQKKKSGDVREQRAEQLRSSFSMDNSSPLFDRELRNAMEHFDERLDNYVAAGVVGVVFPEFVGPRPSEDGVPGHFFRAYYLDTHSFVLLNQEFHIPPLVDEVMFVYRSLHRMDKEGCRLHAVSREDESGTLA